MSSLVIIGAQWGDEGKGKLVDYFTSNAEWSVRFNGGNNAGHTIVYEDKTVKLSLTPSGILRPGCKCLIGAGLVINASVLEGEMQQLRSVGVEINPNRLLLDRNAQLILPHHIAIDQQRELSKGKAKIGTTGRG
ncbi:MAG: adenylosuccinate synthase, partial [SAR324 cluster bacterium]|nr:adenylosuccinate synthase [SAR324 cluster bacterium]